MVKVTNLIGRSGRAIVNQFMISDGAIKYFQSYNTLIAKIENNIIFLDKDTFNYSRTTTKYLMQFIRENTIYKNITIKKAKRMLKEGIFGTLEEV